MSTDQTIAPLDEIHPEVPPKAEPHRLSSDTRELPWRIGGERDGPIWGFMREPGGALAEICATTSAGNPARHANQDGVVVMPVAEHRLLVAVIDGITGSAGIDAANVRDKLMQDLHLLAPEHAGSVLGLMDRLHRELQRWLVRVAPDAATGAAMAVVLIDMVQQHIDWASVGDVRLVVLHGSTSWWRRCGRLRVSARQLNRLAVAAKGSRLETAMGQKRPLRFEFGIAPWRRGDLLVMTTDGGSLPLAPLLAAVERFRNGGPRLLENLLREIDRGCAMHLPGRDDRTIVVIDRGA